MGSMGKRTLLAVLTALVFIAVPASSGAAPNRPATPPPTDFWNTKGFMNFAHQGGERENPGNTLFAFKKSLADGADVIDMDVTLTSDDVLIATHDGEPCHTSDGPCTSFRDLTLEQVRQYDFGYWFSPGLATYYDKSLDVPHPYRGMATGDVAPPPEYSASDFRIATFDEILDAFPNTPMNVELKSHAGAEATAQAAADVLADHPGREKDVIINAFSQEMIDAFHQKAPGHLALGGSLEGTLDYITGTPITPTPVAVQPPDMYDLNGGSPGGLVDTIPILKPHFEYDGFISVVWPSDIDENQETDPWYAKLIGQGADAINTMFPARLHEYLCENGIPRPDGSPRCEQQECPAGQTGIAPDNCTNTPGVLSGISLTSAKGKLKAGKKTAVRVKLSNSGGSPIKVKLKLKSGNREVKVPGSVTVTVPRLKSVTKSISVRATRKAKGKAAITITTQGKTRKVTLKVQARFRQR